MTSFPIQNLGPTFIAPGCPESFDAVIFDFDGTLVDSGPYWETVGERYLAKHGKTVDDFVRMRFKEMTIEQSADFIRDYYGITEPAQRIVEEILSSMEEDYRRNVQPKPGALQTLRILHEARIPMCLATAAERRSVNLMLDRLGIESCFEGLFFCSELGASKTEPLVFEAAAKRMGVPAGRTLVIDDSMHALKTSKQAGFITAGIYDPFVGVDAQDVKALVDLYLESLEQVFA